MFDGARRAILMVFAVLALSAGSIVPRPIALVTTLGPDGCGSACKKDPVSGVIGV